MAIDKNKISEAATKYIQKGQYDKAIKEYRKILSSDPKDARILQKLGELYAKTGDTAQAIDHFLKVAEQYTADGFLLKAIAMYKQIIKLNPDRIDIYFILAQLHQQNGLLGDAMAQYQTIVAHYEAAGNIQACLETLQKIVELDPENTVMRIKLAELCVRQAMTEEAVQELLKVRDLFKKNNRTDDYIKITERIVYLDPTRIDLVRELASAYIALGEAQRALAKLQICFRANPKDIDTLSLLARAFQMSGETLKTASIYKEMARIYKSQNQSRLEKEVWNKVLQLVPNDPDARRHLYPNKPAAPVPPKAPSSGRPPRAQVSQTPPAVSTPPSVKPPAPAQVPAVPAAKPAMHNVAPKSIPGAPAAQAPGKAPAPPSNLTRLLSEADVYIKYGLTGKALDHLSKIFAQFPDSIDAHEKALQIHLKLKDTPAALTHLKEAMRSALQLNDRVRAGALLDKFKTADPGNREIPALAEAVRTGEMPEALMSPAVPPPVPDIAVMPAPAAVPAHAGTRHPSQPSVFVPPPPPAAPIQPPSSRFPSQPQPATDDSDVDWATLDDEEEDFSSGSKAAKSGSEKKAPAKPAAAPSSSDDIDWASLDDEEESPKPAAQAKTSAAADDGIDWASLDADEEEGGKAPAAESAPAVPPKPASSPSSSDDIDWASLDTEEESPKPAAPAAPPAPPAPPAAPTTDDIDWASLDTEEESPKPAAQTAAPEVQVQVPAAVPEPVIPAASFVPAPAMPEMPAEAVQIQQPPPPPPSADVEEMNDMLDEAAFFINQGELADAREILVNAQLSYPGEPRVQEMLNLLEAHEQYYAEQKAYMEQAAMAGTDGYVTDSAAMMDSPQMRLSTGALFDPGLQETAAAQGQQGRLDSAVSFDDVFSEFKKGLEQVVRPEDIETHYDLGLSYREMELFDDAIEEFRQAMRAAKGQPKEADCLTMIALCQISAGHFDDAEASLNQGLALPSLPPLSEIALRFELGSLYELMGRSADALTQFQLVAQRDPRYRDVQGCIARISASM